MENPNGNKPGWIPNLHYWVQLVTPLVYDDSLSLYETMRKVVYKLNQVIDIVNPLGAGIEDTIKKYMTQYYEQWNKELQEWQAQMTQTINNNNTALNQRIDTLTEDLNQKQQDFENSMTQEFNDLNAEILQKVATLAATIQTTDEANRVWTLAQIEDLKKDLTGNFPPVIDPSDGKLESIQVTLNHMWDAWRENALTAQEYDNLELTTDGYDGKELTAISYDRYGKILLVPDSNTVSLNGVPLKKSAVNMEAIVNGQY